MNLENLIGISTLRRGVDVDQWLAIEAGLEADLPEAYHRLLTAANGFALENGLVLYSSDEVVERNETFEVQTYAPGYMAIGDDSGGRCVVIPLIGEGVFLVDHGSMDSDDMLAVGATLDDWVESGAPLDAK